MARHDDLYYLTAKLKWIKQVIEEREEEVRRSSLVLAKAERRLREATVDEGRIKKALDDMESHNRKQGER